MEKFDPFYDTITIGFEFFFPLVQWIGQHRVMLHPIWCAPTPMENRRKTHRVHKQNGGKKKPQVWRRQSSSAKRKYLFLFESWRRRTSEGRRTDGTSRAFLCGTPIPFNYHDQLNCQSINKNNDHNYSIRAESDRGWKINIISSQVVVGRPIALSAVEWYGSEKTLSNETIAMEDACVVSLGHFS